jgi:hypothetical protein
VFYVSANVDIDYVGTIGDPLDPFGAEGFDASFDTDKDTVIFLPGIYTITQPIVSGTYSQTRFFHFMDGVYITYTAASGNFISLSVATIYITGHLYLIHQSSGYVTGSTGLRLFEFNYLEITSSANFVGDNLYAQVKGRHLKVSTGFGLRIATETDIAYAELTTSGTHLEIATNKKATIRFGVITGVDRGVEIKTTAKYVDLKIGSITTDAFAIFGESAWNGYCNIDIGSILCDSAETSFFAVQNIPRFSHFKLNSLTIAGGVNGIQVLSGAVYEINTIIASGGGIAVTNDSNSTYKWVLKCNYLEQNGNAHALRIKLRLADATLVIKNMIDIGYCKHTVAGYYAVYLWHESVQTPVDEIVIKGRYEAVEVPIRCQFTSTLTDSVNVMLDDVTLFSGDASNCITGLNPNNKVRCKNVWANAPVDVNILPVLEGVNVSSEIVE